MGLTKYHSRAIQIAQPSATVYAFLADMRNYETMVPHGANEWNATTETCTFSVRSFGDIELKFRAKEPTHRIICYSDSTKYALELYMEIKELKEAHCEVHIRFEADLNMIEQMVAKKPINSLLEFLIDNLEKQF